MKKISRFLALASGLVLWLPQSRADQLDDLIDGMRSGITVNAGKQAEILKTTGIAVSQSYRDSIVNLYLWEVKASIADPDNNGGWPFRSFLVEGNPSVRKHLTKALKERFEEKPNSILVYAAVCPAIYAGDEKLVDRLQSYLKDHDSFLYKLEQAQIDQFWRPYIEDVLEKEAASTKIEK